VRLFCNHFHFVLFRFFPLVLDPPTLFSSTRLTFLILWSVLVLLLYFIPLFFLWFSFVLFNFVCVLQNEVTSDKQKQKRKTCNSEPEWLAGTWILTAYSIKLNRFRSRGQLSSIEVTNERNWYCLWSENEITVVASDFYRSRKSLKFCYIELF
jgi:hypothetical protein